MSKRIKRIQKQILSLEEQIEKHKQKILLEKGEKDTTPEYWQKEIELKFTPQIEKRKKLLKKLMQGKNQSF
jgi:hypothetical protein